MTTLKDLQDYIATGGWRPIEKAPKDSRDVLVMDKCGLVYKAWHTHGWYSYESRLALEDITHFKPLDADLNTLKEAVKLLEARDE